jgi:hypothetical protein
MEAAKSPGKAALKYRSPGGLQGDRNFCGVLEFNYTGASE